MSISSMTAVIASTTDLVAAAAEGPQSKLGIIIGTSVRGPAFVPISFSALDEFTTIFAEIDSSSFGKIAMKNWLQYSNGSYLRLLGAGDSKRRTSTGVNAGKVNRAGFVVGQELVSTASTIVAKNHRAYENGPLGRTYFLGCFMSESLGSTIFSDAGIQKTTAASGVAATAVDAIDTTGLTRASSPSLMQFSIPSSLGGENDSQVTFILINNADDTGAGPAAGNTIGIGIDTGSVTAAQIAAAIIAAINGTAHARVTKADSGVGASTDGNVLGITAKQGSSDTQITLTAGVGGTVGNITNGVALTSGYDIVDVENFTGGAHGNHAVPILRGVLMAPSGVILSLGTKAASNNVPNFGTAPFPAQGVFSTAGDAGLSFGDVNTKSGGHQEITLLLNGFKATDDYPDIITASLDPRGPAASTDDPSYITTAFNTDPTLIQEAGHYLHLYYNVEPLWAVITGSGITTHHDDLSGTPTAGARKYQTAFLLTSSFARNSGSKSETNLIGCPNFENFENRFATPHSPFVFSQKEGGKTHNLFRIHALSDGKPDPWPNPPPIVNGKPLKITIKNIRPSTVEGQYCKFNLLVRDWGSPDTADLAEGSVTGVEQFDDLDLDPSSDRYISKIIGDMRLFYNFDKPHREQRIEKDGKFPNVSRYIRVEVSPAVEDKSLDENIMPVGFRGIHHLILSGSTSRDGVACSILTGSADALPGSVGTIYGADDGTPATATYHGIKSDILGKMSQIPMPMRKHIGVKTDTGDEVVAHTDLSWGTQFERQTELVYTNEVSTIEDSMRSLVEYFPDFHTIYQNPWVGNNEGQLDVNGTVLDADRYNRNGFTLENIEVITNSTTGLPDSAEWAAARYRRDGKPVTTLPSAAGVESDSRLLLPDKDFFVTPDNPITQFLQFTFPLQGGFNGYNIFDDDKANFRDTAIKREVSDSSQGRKSGPTYSAYKKGFEIIQDKNYDFQILATPGIRQQTVTNLGVEAAEERFDMFYVMDIEQFDENTADVQNTGNGVHAVNTINAFEQRNVDSSFVAVYFPDVYMYDATVLPDRHHPDGGIGLRVPPSVAIMGVMSRNDATYGIGARPTGTVRGNLKPFATVTATMLEDIEVEKSYLGKINPIKEITSGVPTGGAPGPIIQSQVTTLNNETNMSRIDLRRLVIEIRRMTRRVALGTLFEQNTKNTRAIFRAVVQRNLLGYVSNGLLTSYEVSLEDTTQYDVERNIVRGFVKIQPSATNADLFIEIELDV